MNFELYAAFIVASILLAIIPGPNVALIVATSLKQGVRPALGVVLGTSTAQSLQLAVTVAGFASLAVVLAQVFEWLRWVGVAYLLYLAWKAWMAAPVPVDPHHGVKRRFFAQGFVVALFNPKTLLFHGAFLPQFIDPDLALIPQSIVLASTYLVVVTVLDGSYALAAGYVSPSLKGMTGVRLSARLTALIYATAATGVALAKR